MEFEKQFSGAASTGETDSGVARRMTGRWLQFMQERPEGVYMMATCNSFKGIPDEFLRAGRWDGSPFYIGLPTVEEQIAIVSYYINKLKLKFDPEKDLPDMDNWTGAEIEACCEIANNLECDLKEASGYIIPQNKRGFKEAEELKEIAVNASFEKEVGKKRRLDKA